MERAPRPVADDGVSAILQFVSEEMPSTVVAGPTRRDPAAPRPGALAGPRPPSHGPAFPPALDDFRSELPSPTTFTGAGIDRRDTSMLFGETLAARSQGWSGGMIGAAAVAVMIAIGVPAGRWLLAPPVADVRTGTLVIVTNPPGVTALIDGAPGRTTPLNQTIAVGTHTVELRGAGPSRTIAVTVLAGTQAFQYLDMPGVAASIGQLSVHSDPSGAFVTIDGAARGTTPIVADLAPGEHTVVMASGLGWVTRRVSIEAGGMASLAIPATSWSLVAP